MKKIISTLILIALFIIIFFCSCVHLPDNNISDITNNSSVLDKNDSKTESEESSLSTSSEALDVSSYSSKSSYEKPSSQSSKIDISASQSSVESLISSSQRESSNASSAESSGATKGTQLLFDIYENAFEKNNAMDSYNITTAEQYNCPSAGLDESTLFTNIYDAKTDCFSYSFYNKLYGKPSLMEAYGDEKGRVFINDDGNIFLGNRNSISIDLPSFCEFDANDISTSKMGFSLNHTVLYFTIDNNDIFNELINLWSPVIGEGLNDFAVKVNNIEVTVVIDNEGYLVSKTCKIELTATDADENIEQNTLSAEQCIEYASPSDCKPPIVFDFVADLMKQVNTNSSNA